MSNKIKKLIKSIVPKSIWKELSIYKNLSKKYGHWLSVQKGFPVDSGGAPIPWYTYPSIEYLNQFDYSEKSVFEWGSGNSSFYWGERAKEVVSIEDNKEWFEKISKNCSERNKIFLIEDREEYVNAISSQGKKFDIIVIDAKFRDECAKIAPRFLQKGGIIIFDNSDNHWNVLRKMREDNGYIQIDFHGFGAINSYSWTTSVLFNTGSFSFNRKKNRLNSKASLNQES